MRKIKFRAWHNGKFLYLDRGDFELAYDGAYIPLEFGGTETIKEPIEQFTGLRDKNDNEIYEGDIVLLSGIKFNVIFNEIISIFCMMRRTPAKAIRFFGENTTDMVCIIGNIHENLYLSA